MDSQHNMRTQQKTQRGVSLIEILVVLVILVTGILTIIRLFPSGFFSIQSTGNAALADGLGSAAIDLGAQDSSSLPEAILPDDLNTALYSDSLTNAMMTSAQYSNYDPDNPNNLENARVISNETITIPTLVNKQSVYVVKYGPVLMPKDPTTDVTLLPSYFTVNSLNWTALSGNYAPPAAVSAGTPPPTDTPQDALVPGQEQFVVDLASQRIAVPYAPYTSTPDGVTFTLPNGQVIRNAESYDQKMVLTVSYYDTTAKTYGTFTRYLDVLKATSRNSSNPFAPFDSASLLKSQAYLPDANTPGGSGYQGGWFNPLVDYQDSSSGTAGTNPTSSTIQWLSATLYRPYNGLAVQTTGGVPIPFSNDPYEFKLIAANIGVTNANSANPGVIGFNPKSAAGSGTQARKVKISYIVSSWGILREDHDIPALTGAGSTFVVRTTVPNLKLAGSANPDNSINPGIAGSNYSIIIVDLDSGQIVAPGGTVDPTNPDKPINNEDLNGPMHDPKLIDISYALGRLTFGSDAFGDNSSQTPTDGTGTAPAHRVRIFYTADLDWTVAVQKPASYFTAISTPLSVPSETTPLGADQFVYDPSVPCLYVARCNAGKTFEVDGTSTTSSLSPPQSFTQTVAASPVLVSQNAPDVQVPLPAGITPNSTITFSAVRGLSARSLVAWKERNQYKVHSVDAVLNRTP